MRHSVHSNLVSLVFYFALSNIESFFINSILWFLKLKLKKLVLTVERFSINEDLNDESLINTGVITSAGGLERNHKSIRVGGRP